jgi:hypothetical protein
MFSDEYRQTDKAKQNHKLPLTSQLWYCLSPSCAPKEWQVERDLIRRETWIIAEDDTATPYVISAVWPVCPHCTEELHEQG